MSETPLPCCIAAQHEIEILEVKLAASEERAKMLLEAKESWQNRAQVAEMRAYELGPGCR